MYQFTGEGYADGETISFAVSNNNNVLNWTETHGGKPFLTSNVGTRGVRDPTIIRAHDGSKFWILATVRTADTFRWSSMQHLMHVGFENVW